MTEERKERHVVEMMGGKRPTNEGAAIYPRITCESGAEVQVSQVIGGLIQSIDAASINELNFLKVPLFVDCAKHGSYLGFVQILQSIIRNGKDPDAELDKIESRKDFDINRLNPLWDSGERFSQPQGHGGRSGKAAT